MRAPSISARISAFSSVAGANDTRSPPHAATISSPRRLEPATAVMSKGARAAGREPAMRKNAMSAGMSGGGSVAGRVACHAPSS
jgi:hypothetical protein